MITNYKRYTSEHVGMIEYQSYWRSYCLILAVDEQTQTITCLDGFAEVNQHPLDRARIRQHRTAPDHGDKLFTAIEFAAMLEARLLTVRRDRAVGRVA